MEVKRKLFLLKPDQADSEAAFKKIKARLGSLSPEDYTPTNAEQLISLDGNVVIIPLDSWSSGILSGITRCSDLLAIAIVSRDADIERVKLWYELGIQLVLDEGCSAGVLVAAVERLLAIDAESWRSKLTRRELMIFEALRQAGTAGLSRGEIAERLWNRTSVHEKTIDVHIFNLRRKLNSTRYRVTCSEQRFVLAEAARMAPGERPQVSALSEGPKRLGDRTGRSRISRRSS